ncbi:MAG TPA: Holliday junction resolvase RuvX, partial [Aeromicrobium sp.]|nr:Holliday junction resolvase RuvX [Aeromicrobium sp.]
EGPAAAKVRTFAISLAAHVAPVPVRLVDERMSTMAAEGQLRASGRSGRKKRAVIDQVAATVILQSALDIERAQGIAAGEGVS